MTNGDGARWRTLTTIIFITGAAAAIFAGGMSYGTVQSKLDAKEADVTYVRKDGRELEEIRGSLRGLNDKVDYLIRQGQGAR
ncbi:MAG TPA: hypothetical protein VF456_17010 [Vicinamibacterales bacterium]